jgi:O-acetyl-ADP-ribose deacetylase (regulator of RNase III)
MPEVALGTTQINQSVVQLIKGDITDLDVEAFVFYAQHDLTLGAGFGNAIAVRGGPSVQKELEGLGPLDTGDAVVTGAGKMKAKHIIHAVGPRFREEDIPGKLRTTMQNALKLANENRFEQVAFPAMGAGYYGVPADVSAGVMFGMIKAHLEGETSIREIIICVLDTPQYEAFQARLAELG